MERPNPFYRRSRISAKKFRQLLRLFALDLTATDVAQLTGLTRKSVTTIFLRIRGRIAEECERQSPLSSGQVEVDESYFGARRVRGKRGRGASGKTIVFGLLKRDGKVYTEIVPDCKKATLQAIIRGRVAPEVVIHSDGWRGYDGLVDVGYSNTSGSTTAGTSSCAARITSTASRASGVTPSRGCISSTALPRRSSTCT
jgi:transposase